MATYEEIELDSPALPTISYEEIELDEPKAVLKTPQQLGQSAIDALSGAFNSLIGQGEALLGLGSMAARYPFDPQGVREEAFQIGQNIGQDLGREDVAPGIAGAASVGLGVINPLLGAASYAPLQGIAAEANQALGVTEEGYTPQQAGADVAASLVPLAAFKGAQGAANIFKRQKFKYNPPKEVVQYRKSQMPGTTAAEFNLAGRTPRIQERIRSIEEVEPTFYREGFAEGISTEPGSNSMMVFRDRMQQAIDEADFRKTQILSEIDKAAPNQLTLTPATRDMIATYPWKQQHPRNASGVRSMIQELDGEISALKGYDELPAAMSGVDPSRLAQVRQELNELRTLRSQLSNDLNNHVNLVKETKGIPDNIIGFDDVRKLDDLINTGIQYRNLAADRYAEIVGGGAPGHAGGLITAVQELPQNKTQILRNILQPGYEQQKALTTLGAGEEAVKNLQAMTAYKTGAVPPPPLTAGKVTFPGGEVVASSGALTDLLAPDEVQALDLPDPNPYGFMSLKNGKFDPNHPDSRIEQRAYINIVRERKLPIDQEVKIINPIFGGGNYVPIDEISAPQPQSIQMPTLGGLSMRSTTKYTPVLTETDEMFQTMLNNLSDTNYERSGL